MFENITNAMNLAVDDIIMCRIMSFFIESYSYGDAR
jgi:hypothetical protein